MISIQRRLTITLLIGFGLLLAGGGTALYFGTRAMLLGDFDSALLAKARALASLTESDHGKIEFHFENELMPEFAAGSSEAFYQLFLPEGKTLRRSDSLGNTELPLLHREARNLPTYSNLSLRSGKAARVVGITFLPGDEDERTPSESAHPLTIVVALSREHLDRYLHRLALGVITTSLLMMAGAILIAAFAVRRGLQPLARLGQQVAAIDEASLHARISGEQLPAELTPICHRLNDFLERLDRAFSRERQFSDDVAHELRTPLAELRTLAEFSLSTVTDEPQQRAFQDTLDISREMEGMVNSLLAIARCESKSQTVARENVPLLSFLRDLWETHAARAAERSLEVEFRVSPDLVVSSDWTLLRTILANLLSNAVDHSSPNSPISITATSDGSLVHLAVSNRTDALTAADLPHLFERFWRKDAARSSTGHAGLGLPIARAAARLLKTELQAEISPEGVFRIALEIPAAAQVGQIASLSSVEDLM